MSAYEFAQKSALKLKGVQDGSGISKKKKKKSKKSTKDQEREEHSLVADTPSGSSSEGQALPPQPVKTAAEIAFLKKREKLDADRIRQKASVSHKDRVSKFNEYLDSLSEHYEQAKVSWTK